jgi:hypothetical protein
MAQGDLIYTGPDQSGSEPPSAPGAPSAGGTSDPSLVSGQDPVSFLGIPFSYDTGLGGSAPPGGHQVPPGQSAGTGGQTVNQPDQYPDTEAVSGVSLTGGTGIEGSQGAPPDQIEQPGQSFAVTNPNNFAGWPGGGSGTQQVTVPVAQGGPNDSTMVAGQYPPAKPLPAGNFYPTDDGVGSGHVLVGGWEKGQRG